MAVKVSIVVPCYGVEKFLDRCLKSLTNQTLRDIEIVLVDDGSPDSVPEICDVWAKNDSRIKVIHKNNGGLGFARNSGLEVVSGEYVSFVDSDDFVDFKMYETFYTEAIINNAEMVCCCHKIELPNGCFKDIRYVNDKIIFDSRAKVQEYLLDLIANDPKEKKERKYGMSVWRCLYRRDIIESKNIRFRSEREVGSEDIPFQCEYLQHVNKLVYLPQCFYHYCINGSSLTSTFKPEKYERFKKLRKVLLDVNSKIPLAEQRINRLFIGYTRSYLLNMFKQNISSKKSLINEIVEDPIWKNISKTYPDSYMTLNKYILYKLIVSKHPDILMFVCLLMSKF